jgi:hypothetical protein
MEKDFNKLDEHTIVYKCYIIYLKRIVLLRDIVVEELSKVVATRIHTPLIKDINIPL